MSSPLTIDHSLPTNSPHLPTHYLPPTTHCLTLTPYVLGKVLLSLVFFDPHHLFYPILDGIVEFLVSR